jgi:hypothetical protein
MIAGRLLLVVVTAAAILAAAALAAPGRRPAVGPRLRVSAAGAMRISNSRGNRAILVSPALGPGHAATGSVTIRNHGAAGRLTLSLRRLEAIPDASVAALAGALRLTARELTPESRALLYSGPLVATPKLHLGLLQAGAKRRFGFAVRLPAGAPVDAAAMGTGVRFDLRWRIKPAR